MSKKISVLFVVSVLSMFVLVGVSGCSGSVDKSGADEDAFDSTYEKPDYDWSDGDDSVSESDGDVEDSEDIDFDEMTIEDRGPEITWCNLQHPHSLMVVVGTQSEPVYGRVYVNQVTDYPGQGLGITAQVGFGPKSADMQSSSWKWFDAEYNTDVDGLTPGDLANDEYKGTLLPENTGSFGFAYRFAIGVGNGWTYCGKDGIISNPEAASGLGDLEVVDAPSDGDEESEMEIAPEMEEDSVVDAEEQAPVISWCNLQYPQNTSTVVDTKTEPIYGRVFVDGITNGEGQGEGILAQAGFGPAEAPLNSRSWYWFDASYNIDVDGLVPGDLANDEYQARLLPPITGSFGMAYRFSLDGGSSWTYCGTAGMIEDPADAHDLGKLSVVEAVDGDEDLEPDLEPEPEEIVDTAVEEAEPEVEIEPEMDDEVLEGAVDEEVIEHPIGWCNLQWPYELTLASGEESENIYGRVYVEGITPGAGQGVGVIGQVGFGPLDSSMDSDGWTWSDAAYNIDVDGLVSGDLANDEYMGTITPNLADGTYGFGYRFSTNGGTSWTYCGKNGIITDVANPDGLGTLEISNTRK